MNAMKKILLVIFYLFFLVHIQAQSKVEIENYLEAELKNMTYFKTDYELKTAKYECEYFVDYKDGNFIFTSNTISVGKMNDDKTSDFHEITIAPKDILWQDLGSVQVESEMTWVPTMPFYHINLNLKPFSTGKVKSKSDVDNVVQYNIESYFEVGKEFMVEVRNEGRMVQAPYSVQTTKFKFLSAEENEEANQIASEALFYIFELAKLSGAEEYKP